MLGTGAEWQGCQYTPHEWTASFRGPVPCVTQVLSLPKKDNDAETSEQT